MAEQSSEWKPNGRPTSVIALNFSAALDDLFNLGPSAELASNVEQKRNQVRSYEENLQHLNDRLRQATEQLKRLESKHKRMQSEHIMPRGRRTQNTNSYSDSEGTAYSDDQSATSDAVHRA